MLLISRKVGESILLSENIRITVVSLGNDKVTIGIDAPKEIKIVREELLDTIEANKASNETIDQTNYQGIAALLKSKKNNGDK